ncbi:uncharacterized protein LOC129808446 [Phlebotomus papatasi]|uniref:uncharacterized protein LOC129808446 n=1 Tax=Phlebotomus papatasi TaxID=29031 RepID=UPI0024837C7D|nr:uncharacterized protein LOC129808446 [Phlebotomus papatasi]
MGSPINPIIADIVMQRAIEETLKGNMLRILFIKKYVDDLLLAVHKDDVNDVLQQFNSFHPRIQYKMEIEDNGVIPYLDTVVHRISDGENLRTSWYSKAYPPRQRERESPTIYHSITYIPGVSERIRRIVGETLRTRSGFPDCREESRDLVGIPEDRVTFRKHKYTVHTTPVQSASQPPPEHKEPPPVHSAGTFQGYINIARAASHPTAAKAGQPTVRTASQLLPRHPSKAISDGTSIAARAPK